MCFGSNYVPYDVYRKIAEEKNADKPQPKETETRSDGWRNFCWAGTIAIGFLLGLIIGMEI